MQDGGVNGKRKKEGKKQRKDGKTKGRVARKTRAKEERGRTIVREKHDRIDQPAKKNKKKSFELSVWSEKG